VSALGYLAFARRALHRSGPPLHLTLFVTGRCNLRCRHCFHWREVAASVEGPPLEALERLARSVERMGPLLWLALGGGEPFLRADLASIAAAFARGGLRHLSIPTNGLVERAKDVALEILARCPDTFLSISVSIDGPPGVHDAIRGVEGAHARALEQARALLALAREHERLGVGLILTVTRENQHVLGDHMEELVRELAPHNVTINLARGTALDPSLLDVDVEAYRAVVQRKERLVTSGALPYFAFPMARVAIARDRLMYEHVARVADAGGKDLGPSHLPCTAGSLSAVIFEDGRVAPCEMLDASIGNLAEVDWDLARLWNGDAAVELRERIERTRCRCTWECAQADNVLFRARNWPRLALEGMRS
jgi:MoaA/NifB/PqqE/SkfB family radical SAM enzyme